MDALTEQLLTTSNRPKSTRQVLGEFMMALAQLLRHLEIQADMPDLSVNFDGRAMRVDIARLTADGQHLAEWFVGLNANVLDPAFAARVPLPDQPVAPGGATRAAH